MINPFFAPTPTPTPPATTATDTPATTATDNPLRDLLPEDFASLAALARSSGAVADSLSDDEAINAVWDKLKDRAERVWTSRARRLTLSLARYLVHYAAGVRGRDALRMADLDCYGRISRAVSAWPIVRTLHMQAEAEHLSALTSPIVDAMHDAAIDGDTSVKRDKDGNIVAETHRANTKAAEMLLKAASPRFRDTKTATPGEVGGGVTYIIGGGVTINAAPLPPAIAPKPVTATISAKSSPNIIDADQPEVSKTLKVIDFTED